MICSNPLFRFPYDTPENIDWFNRYMHGFLVVHRPYNKSIFLNLSEYNEVDPIYRHRFMQINCGRCLGCRLERAKEWSRRCMLEAQFYPFNYFVTLTYNDEFLPPYKGGVLPGGETFTSELRRKDLQLFIKRLRSYCKYHFNHTGIRYFYCGEYGSLNERPHYHIILFNLPELTDLKLHSKPSGFPIYTSDLIQRCWSNGTDFFGFSTVGAVDQASCDYTARYILKKQLGDAANSAQEWFCDHKTYYVGSITYKKPLKRKISPYRAIRFFGFCRGRRSEFIGMSLKPGIGARYLDENSYVFKYDQVILKERDRVSSIRPPRYFEKRFDHDIEASWHLEDLKDIRRHKAFHRSEHLPDIPLLQQASDAELKALSRLSKLRRYLD